MRKTHKTLIVVGICYCIFLIVDGIYAIYYYDIDLFPKQNDNSNNSNNKEEPYLPPQEKYIYEIDDIANATYIVDGDTFDTNKSDRIRLADIDTPELGDTGYQEAKDFLSSLIFHKIIYLDIDDFYGTDKYGRIVAVIYLSYNSTHLLNVNKALLENDLAVIWNFYNEFNPYIWTLYIKK